MQSRSRQRWGESPHRTVSWGSRFPEISRPAQGSGLPVRPAHLGSPGKGHQVRVSGLSARSQRQWFQYLASHKNMLFFGGRLLLRN
jgi:hypothetical protein